MDEKTVKKIYKQDIVKGYPFKLWVFMNKSFLEEKLVYSSDFSKKKKEKDKKKI
jgi:hypothetical protein